MMLKRWLSALVLLAIVFVAVWFDSPAYSVVLAVFATLAALEFFDMAGLPRYHPLTIFGLVWVLLFILVAHFEGNYPPLLLASAVGFSLIWLIFSTSVKDAAVYWAWTLAGIIYIGWMLSHFIPLRQLEITTGETNLGRDWVLFALFANIAVDTAAFFVGRAWGRHRLAINISAGKTWEGSIAGFVAGIAAALVLVVILPNLSDVPYWQAAILGALVGVFAQLGDLAESLLKRSAGLKDSGTMVPGHGGLLDRMDSLLFSVVVVYYYVIYVVI
jgi:phosphatidate cytidylyltransferase